MAAKKDKRSTGDLKAAMQEQLAAILQWWIKRMTDEENGGFYGRIDGLGKLYPSADKGVILNTRILWTFAAAARLTNSAAYKNIADRAYAYILQYFKDQQAGGVFWMLDYKGQAVQGKKQIYAQTFCIYALSEYFLLTEKNEALSEALHLFELVEKHSRDWENGGYFEAFNRDWEPLEDLRLSEKDVNAAKTMNTHLHLLEAYTNLYRAYPEENVKAALKNLIECFLTRFISAETHHLHLFFDERWRLQSHEISFGHDIECSWLLTEAAEVSGDRALIHKATQIAVVMAEVCLREGLDQDGGLFNEARPDGHVDMDKHWWPQAEAMIGFWNAWEISGKEIFQQAALNSWNFIQTVLLDDRLGEWRWRVNRSGEPILREDIAGPWKAPYHNGRMCMEMIKRWPDKRTLTLSLES